MGNCQCNRQHFVVEPKKLNKNNQDKFCFYDKNAVDIVPTTKISISAPVTPRDCSRTTSLGAMHFLNLLPNDKEQQIIKTKLIHAAALGDSEPSFPEMDLMDIPYGNFMSIDTSLIRSLRSGMVKTGKGIEEFFSGADKICEIVQEDSNISMRLMTEVPPTICNTDFIGHYEDALVEWDDFRSSVIAFCRNWKKQRNTIHAVWQKLKVKKEKRYMELLSIIDSGVGLDDSEFKKELDNFNVLHKTVKQFLWGLASRLYTYFPDFVQSTESEYNTISQIRTVLENTLNLVDERKDIIDLLREALDVVSLSSYILTLWKILGKLDQYCKECIGSLEEIKNCTAPKTL